MSKLKRVAFVAMPFGVKETGAAPGQGPVTVDFDALWELAILPALTELDYLPIRADNQTGSVIVKDMLEQLVFADLVIADISIPNGNVYYEAGVRHAAKREGCILICADWARPLFDLRQITQLRYPFGSSSNAEPNHADIRRSLVDGIPALAQSEGPVFELTRIGEPDADDARQLNEVSAALFAFQARLRTARIKASEGDKAPLRALITEDMASQLPAYAVTDLVRAVRDNLEWHQLNKLLINLGDVVRSDPYLMEQQALAIGKMGNIAEAIGLLEQIVEEYGESPIRLGTIGSRYREQSRNAGNKNLKRQRLSKAINAYERGMLLDLNRYYCAHKLIVALVERGRSGDREKAIHCARLVLHACERAQELRHADEWLESTLLVHAFFVEDYAKARELAEALLDRGWANWKLMSLSRDLESIANAIDDEKRRSPFEELIEEIKGVLPKTQSDLMAIVGPRLEQEGRRYQKSKGVMARPAVEGEVIISVTESGEETTNVAIATDMVVQNQTRAGEFYIVGEATFTERYDLAEDEPDANGMRRYLPKGQVIGLEITHEITTALEVGSEFYIRAPWKEEQYACEGDFLVTPLPAKKEIYRIGRAEFEQTYGEVGEVGKNHRER
ncbi:MAG: tetratricopeptide repeat-containing protein [Pseudomonadota bacterium]